MARQLDNVASALPLELVKYRASATNAAGKNGIGHCSTNLFATAAVGKKESISFAFDARHFLAVINTPHTHGLPCSHAEQTSDDDITDVGRNGLTNSVSGQLLSAARFQRQTAFAVLPCAARAAVRLPINRRPKFPAVAG